MVVVGPDAVDPDGPDDFEDEEQAANRRAAAAAVHDSLGARIGASYARNASATRHARGRGARRLDRRGSRPPPVSHGRAAVPVPRASDRGAGDRRGALHDPERERAAREPRPAAGRGRVPDPLQFPARPPVGRAAGQGLRHRRARPAQGRRGARDEAAVPHPVEGAAVAAAQGPGQGESRRARPAASTCSRASSPTRATASTRSRPATTARSTSRSCRSRSRSASAKTCR